MNKRNTIRNTIRILSNAAKLYNKNLEDQKVLFLYGIPKGINEQIQRNTLCLTQMKGYEVAFLRSNFLHLTGVKIANPFIRSSIHFYQMCLSSRLTENDFRFSEDGSSFKSLKY